MDVAAYKAFVASSYKDSVARTQLDSFLLNITMEKNNADAALVPDTTSKHGAQHEFKKAAVPAERFWILSVG